MKQHKSYHRYHKIAAYGMFIMTFALVVFIIGASIKYGGIMWPLFLAPAASFCGGMIYLQQARAIQEEIDLEERVNELERSQENNYRRAQNNERRYTSYTYDRKYRSKSDRRRR